MKKRKVKITKKSIQSKKQKRKKRLKIAGIVLLVISIILLLLTLLSYSSAKNVYNEAMAGKDSIFMAKDAISDQNFAQTATSLSEAKEHFTSSHNSLNNLKWAKYIPWVGRQVKAVDKLLAAGVKGTAGMETLALLGEDIAKIAKIEGEETSFNKIGKKKKKEILKKLYESPEEISQASTDLESAISEIEQIPKKGLVKPLRDVMNPIQDNLPLAKELISKAGPLFEVLPSIAGYPEEKTYLFLLQNNNEMRATGGFIGTYGILKVESAEINTFETDNIYNLDNPAKEYLFVDPPEPFNKYIGSTQWFMRDSNWSPDFPTAAQKAEEFYGLENGPEKNIHGLIAITPEVIGSLIGVTGPIVVEGEEFTADNFVEKLQYKVGFSFWQEGISDKDRKNVIGDMANILMDNIMNLPKERWIDLWSAMAEDARQKQMFLYLKDDALQKYVTELNWDGRMQDIDYTGRDFFMVVDTNLAALKTDEVMDRSLDYTVNKEGDDLVSTLKVTYKNNGTFSNTTTRYRTYTRIFVPKGSELISSEGFLTNDKLSGGTATPALSKIDEELNKTVFEGFIAIEPQAEETVTLKYKLPVEISNFIDDNEYRVYCQKQGGTKAHGLSINIDIGEKIDTVEALDLNTEINNNEVRISGDLEADRDIKIQLK